ncbi:MAG: alpha/beta hydrolase fold domain-containing protein [Planctomycetota bacterium]
MSRGISNFLRTILFGAIGIAACSILDCSQSFGQKATADKPPERPSPTVADYKYGNDSERQRFDFWKAESDAPTPVVLLIHGGGWRNGDKTGFGNNPIRRFLKEGISVAAINYRFIDQAMEQRVEPPVKAPLMDAARALQTIRVHAKEWNIDPNQIGATGGSAGACTSLWLALHDDLADPTSSDPIARESSRLACAAVSGAQTSLDPKQLREWIGNSIYGGHAFGFAAQGRSREQEFELLLENREKVLPWIREYSPIEWVSKDDPPIFLEYPKQAAQPVLGGKEPDPTHSAMYGVQLQKACKSAGVRCDLVFPENKDSEFSNSNEFLIYHLKN